MAELVHRNFTKVPAGVLVMCMFGSIGVVRADAVALESIMPYSQAIVQNYRSQCTFTNGMAFECMHTATHILSSYT
jgi:hypothetical protein